MSKQKDPEKLTIKESAERLKAVKDFLGNGERVTYVRSELVIDIPNYNPNSLDAFFCRGAIDYGSLKNSLTFLESLSCYSGYGDPRSYLHSPLQIGTVIPMVFFGWKDPSITKYCVLWIGTWHHAPIAMWKHKNQNTTFTQKLPKYIDLL